MENQYEKYFASSSVNWLTPPEIIEAAKKALGGIDLDPCPSTDPLNWFATENWSLGGPVDSLRSDWKVKGQPATVFVNPPFGTSYISRTNCISAAEYKDHEDKERWQKQTIFQWAKKCVEEYEKGCEIIWLSKAAIENKALQLILRASSATCFPEGRIAYINPVTLEKQNQPTFGSIVLWLGHYKGEQEFFIETFSPLGVCKRLL
jgi:DNA N-6-adenine-methyltransferase (Dam).